MKRLFLLAAAACMGLLARAQNDQWANFERYSSSNAELRTAPDSLRRVVFFGNSITDFWPGIHPEFFSLNGFVGRGISGQTTYQFLSRFREYVVNLHPAIVVINAATNDVAENTCPYDPERTMGNIMSMVELAEANGIKVVLTSTLPASTFYWRSEITDIPAKIKDLNTRIEAYARAKGLPYVDYYSRLVAADGSLDLRYTDDGVHPTAAGYDVMESLILPVIANY